MFEMVSPESIEYKSEDLNNICESVRNNIRRHRASREYTFEFRMFEDVIFPTKLEKLFLRQYWEDNKPVLFTKLHPRPFKFN